MIQGAVMVTPKGLVDAGSGRPFGQPEEWRSIAGFEGAYEVSNLGRVRSIRFDPPRVIWQGRNNTGGYPYVRLWIAGKLSTHKVHRLVCRAFHGEPNVLHTEVAHLDGNPCNAAAGNLRWVSKAENRFHRTLHGNNCDGDRHPRASLTNEAAEEIRRRRSEPRKSLAAEYGVSLWVIQDVLRGRRYAKPRVTPAEENVRRRGAAEWLRAILKRCEELTVVEEGDDLEEALNALADIRGLIREVLNNPPPAFTAALSEVRGGQ